MNNEGNIQEFIDDLSIQEKPTTAVQNSFDTLCKETAPLNPQTNTDKWKLKQQ